MIKDDIRRKLFEMGDEKLKAFSSKLTPGEENIIGVSVPKVKQLAKEIVKGDYKTFLIDPYTNYHEERLLYGLVLGYIKTDITSLVNYLNIWLNYVDNWAVCDCSVANLKCFKKAENRKVVFDYLVTKLNAKDNPYIIRFVIVALFDYFIDEQYLDRVVKIYSEIKSDHYYINMALAWGISVICIKNYAIGIELISSNSLNLWVRNKAIQKSIESFRLTDIQKQKLKLLKRN